MNKLLLIVALSTLSLISTFVAARHSFSQSAQTYQSPDLRSQWVGKCLTQINTIKPGSSQQTFDKLFEVAGGLSDGKTYSFRSCPYFKVTAQLKGGKVVSISRPYLDQVAYD